MRRRHITTAVTLLVLCGVLVAGAVWGYRSLFADFPDASLASPQETGPTCDPQKFQAGERVRASQVVVSVFNAGTRSGLASETLNTLANRGFKLGDAGNAPSDAVVRRVQVWSTDEDDVEARLVARQFGRSTKVKFSEVDLGPGVDVVVGNGYRGLAKAPRSIRAERSQQVCVPVDPLTPTTKS